LVIWNQASKLELETGESNGSGILELSKIIFRCPNLKKLQLVLHDYNRILYQFRRDRRNANRGNMKDCRESMQKFLDIHKGRFRNNKAPAVSVYYFAHLGEQRRNELTIHFSMITATPLARRELFGILVFLEAVTNGSTWRAVPTLSLKMVKQICPTRRSKRITWRYSGKVTCRLLLK
jgi:hypothetical protein